MIVVTFLGECMVIIVTYPCNVAPKAALQVHSRKKGKGKGKDRRVRDG
jgi:hypothetical protein